MVLSHSENDRNVALAAFMLPTGASPVEHRFLQYFVSSELAAKVEQSEIRDRAVWQVDKL